MSVITGVLFVGLSVLISLLWCNIIAMGDYLTRRAHDRRMARPDRTASDVLA